MGCLALYRGARELGFSLWRLSYREDFTTQSGPQLSKSTVRISLFAHWCPYSNLILNFSPTREISSGDERGSEGHGGLCWQYPRVKVNRTSLRGLAEEILTRNIWDQFLSSSSTMMHNNTITNKGVWGLVFGDRRSWNGRFFFRLHPPKSASPDGSSR